MKAAISRICALGQQLEQLGLQGGAAAAQQSVPIAPTLQDSQPVSGLPAGAGQNRPAGTAEDQMQVEPPLDPLADTVPPTAQPRQ
eukprot:3987911-Amphidinium_carterae.1